MSLYSTRLSHDMPVAHTVYNKVYFKSCIMLKYLRVELYERWYFLQNNPVSGGAKRKHECINEIRTWRYSSGSQLLTKSQNLM